MIRKMATRRSPHAQDEETLAAFDPLLPDEPAAQAPPEEREPAIDPRLAKRLVHIAVPLLTVHRPRYSARHVDVQLDAGQAETLTAVLEALDQDGGRLKSGRRIASAADGLRWLLEQIDEQRGSS